MSIGASAKSSRSTGGRANSVAVNSGVGGVKGGSFGFTHLTPVKEGTKSLQHSGIMMWHFVNVGVILYRGNPWHRCVSIQSYITIVVFHSLL